MSVDRLVAACNGLYYLGLDAEVFDVASVAHVLPKTLVALEIGSEDCEADDIAAMIAWMLRHPRGVLSLSRKVRNMAHFKTVVEVRHARRQVRAHLRQAVPSTQRAQVRDIFAFEEIRAMLGYVV